jgi:hypothetical protein
LDDASRVAELTTKHSRFWTESSTNKLLEMRSAGISVVSIASQLDTTVDSVNSRMRTLGLPRRPQFYWTPEADRWLYEYYRNPRGKRTTMKVILKSLNPSPTPAAAYQRASRLGLTIKSK